MLYLLVFYHKYQNFSISTIFKTTDDGERIVSFFNKAKIESENFARQLEKDKVFLTDYFNAVGDVTKQQEILNRASTEASQSALEYAVNTKGAAGSVANFEQQQLKANNSIRQSKNYFDMSTVSANAYKMAVKGITLVANMASNALIGGLVFALSKLFTAQDEAIQKAKELTQTFESDQKALDDYKTKINTLVTELNSSNISYEDSKTKRKELMVVQDELIQKYGTEEQVIKSITAAINGEVDALDNLSQKAYYEWLASVDDLTGWQEFGNGFFTLTTGITDQYKSALDSAVEYMEDKTKTFFVKTTGNAELDKLIQDQFGLYKNDFNEFVIKDVVPEEAYELLGEIRTAYRDNATRYLGTETDAILTTVNDSIQTAMTSIDTELQKHQDTYHTYLEGMIKYDSEYSDEYADLLAKRALLEEAELSVNDEGKQQRVLDAKKAFYDSLNKAMTESEGNDNVQRYFENLYPDLQAEFSDWQFEYNLVANTDSLGDTAKALGEKYDAKGLLELVDDDSAVIKDNAFNSLIDKAIEFGICTDKSSEEVQKLIDLLVELGIVQSNIEPPQNPNKSTIFSTEDFNKEIKSYEDGYNRLLEVQEEWNNSKAISASTFVELQENGLLEYLEYTSEGLKVNTDKLLENAQVCKDKAVADLHAAMTSDMLAVAIKNTDSMSDEAKAVIEQLGDNVEISGEQALTSAQNWATFGTTMARVMREVGVKGISLDQRDEMKAIYDYYKDMADAIGEIDITTPSRTKASSSATKEATKEAKDTTKTFNWIETLLSRIQRTITNLGKTVSATYKNWSTRNNALAQEMQAVNQEISAQQQAYQTYINKANSIGLSDYYKNLVMNGGFSIEEIADDTLKEQIKEFQNYYDKALDASDAISDLNDELADLAKTKFDNISSQYNGEISLIEHNITMLDGFVKQTESAGMMASEAYYKAMSEGQQKNISMLKNQYSSLLTSFNEAVNNGSIEKFSEDWFDMYSEINSVEEALQSATTELIEFNQTLQQSGWEVFDRIQESINGIGSEADFLIELLNSKDLYNDNGSLTSEGLAAQGLHAVKYNTYMEQSAKYAEEITEIEQEMVKDPYDLELIDRRNELLDLQRECIQNSLSEKDAILDLAKNGYDKMIDSLNELIDKRRTALQAEKDLYDYSQRIEEQVDDVSRLQKILSSISDDNSEEGKALVQKYSVELESSKKSLEQSQYEKYIDDQQKILDSLADDAQEWVNTRLDNIDGLISDVIDATNENAGIINKSLLGITKAFGIELSDEMGAIWNEDGNIVKDFSDAINGEDSVLTSVNKVLDNIDIKMQSMLNELSKQAERNIETINNAQEEIINQQTNTTPTVETTSTTATTQTNTQPESEPTSEDEGKVIFTGGKFYEDSYKGGRTGNGDNKWTGHEVEVNRTSKTGMVHIVDKATGTILGWVDKDQLNGYYTGTTNAKQGIAKVSEKGDEIILDNEGNVLLAKGKQLFPFNGGETVIDASETAKLLKGELVPLNNQLFMDNIVKTPKLPDMVSRGGNGGSVENDIHLNIAVKANNYDEFCSSFKTAIKNDPQCRKLVQAITIDEIAGKGSLRRNIF